MAFIDKCGVLAIALLEALATVGIVLVGRAPATSDRPPQRRTIAFKNGLRASILNHGIRGDGAKTGNDHNENDLPMQVALKVDP